MAEKRVKVAGYIALPEAADLPEIGSTISGSYRAEVQAHVEERESAKAQGIRIRHTARATIVEDGASIESTEPPTEQPMLGEEPEDDD